MESSYNIMRKYRDDRRKLLQFLFSSGIVKEIPSPGGLASSISSIDLDSISTDYVLECIKSGCVLDVSQAKKRYQDEFPHPITCGDIFYLRSEANSSGSPPPCIPPETSLSHAELFESHNSEWCGYPDVEKTLSSRQENKVNSRAISAQDVNHQNSLIVPSARLPGLKTGLSDDDLRESAYEVFLACILFSRVEFHATNGKKREKSSKILTGWKNRRDKRPLDPKPPERNSEILDIIRVQMQISETTDAFVRRRLTQFATGKHFGGTDIPQMTLGLLSGISRTDFSSEKSYIHWKNRQANVLEELLISDQEMNDKRRIKASLAKIRNPEEWDLRMSPSERNDFLLAIHQTVLKFTSKRRCFDIEGETYYWTSGYHLNIRLYEKILGCVFDILEDGQLIEEMEEILKLIKLTWSMLGITDRLHHALFAWKLFQQFVCTEEVTLLDYAIGEAEKVFSSEVADENEVAYIKSLMCSSFYTTDEPMLNLLQSIFLSISLWCDSKLQDYHLHFSENNPLFKKVVEMALSVSIRNAVSLEDILQLAVGHSSEVVTRKVRGYIENSLDAACNRVTFPILGSRECNVHPLATLANELILIAKRELSMFIPALTHLCPKCAVISSKKLHQYYSYKLKPFLHEVKSLTEDIRNVLSSAYDLESCLIQLCLVGCKDVTSCSIGRTEFLYYPIADVSKPIILDWIVAQHERILEWTGRAFDLEEWEPLSSQKKHGASAIEVFRIIEETVDQFFGLRLPLDFTHLQALLSIIFHSLDSYLLKVFGQLVDKKKLYPSTPPLTRYKEAAFPIVKKKSVEHLILDCEIHKQLDELETSKLCIRLNTYQYINKQTAILEDGIRRSWESVSLFQMNRNSSEENKESLPTVIDLNDESVTELFVATLDCIRDTTVDAIKKTADFLGAKFVFWDLRDSFLFYLYHGGVEGNRMDGVLHHFDKNLNSVCKLIDETIRDLVVSCIYKASLEGFIWILLDGGPSRAFSDNDIALIEEDLILLKDLFIADGEGLPRTLVEEESKFSHQILSLFSLKTESLIQMLMASSEHISVMTSDKYAPRHLVDAQTLIRVLCHKKEGLASKFLKKHYHLPSSSEYDGTSTGDSSFYSPLLADIVKRSTSVRWSEKGQSSFRSIKKKFQETKWT